MTRHPSRLMLAATLGTALVASSLSSQETPIPVSPGAAGQRATLEEPCPSFHWSAGQTSEGYEILVYRTNGVELAANRPDGHDAAATALALREVFPPGVSSWTPPLERCLEPGSSYAWTVRSLDDIAVHAAWTPSLRVFHVRDQSRAEQLVGRVIARLVREGELSERDQLDLGSWGFETATSGDPGAAPALAALRDRELPDPAPLLGSSPSMDGIVRESSAGTLLPGAGFFVRADGRESGISVFGVGTGKGVESIVQQAEFGYAAISGSVGSSITTPGLIAHGVWGASSTNAGRGVSGRAYGGAGPTFGVFGQSDSNEGTGVKGFATSDDGTTYGVYGEVDSPTGFGVYGEITSTDAGTNYAVYGKTPGPDGRAVAGVASSSTGTNYGVVGQSNSSSGFDFYAAGVGTDYGPFTGGHEVRLAPELREVVPGMVVAVTGRAEVRRQNGVVDLSSTLPTVSLARRVADPAVFGVLVAESELSDTHWYAAQPADRFATVNALGEGRVWVTDANGVVKAGDLLTSSPLPGYAQKQDDDVFRAYTVGKVIESIDWDRVTESVEHDGCMYRRALVAVVYTSG